MTGDPLTAAHAAAGDLLAASGHALRAVQPLLQNGTVQAGNESPLLAVLAFLGLFTTAGLAVLIAYETVKGYRGSGDRALLFVAVGILLLTTVPILVGIAVPTFAPDREYIRIIATSASELAGLGAILYAIYGQP